jgi:hypothetical protein
MKHLSINSAQAHSCITWALLAKKVPMLHGSPGTGKSSIVKAVAKEHGLKVIDLRLAQCDPTDLLGFPTIVGDRSGYRPMDTFPIEGDTVPEGFNGWLLFLDELTSASMAVQAAAYKLILDRMVGNYHLHKKVAIVGAGNLATDGAIVYDTSTALQSRMVHLLLETDNEKWLDWAYANGIDHRITSYIKFKPANLYAFKPDHTDLTYACNRTWEFAHDILTVVQDISNPDLLPLLAGTLSEGIAREFLSFCKIDRDLPKVPEIVNNPMGTKVPSEPSVLYAICGSMAHHFTEDNADPLIKYIDRLPKEFQAMTLRETVRRNKSVMALPSVRGWISRTATEYF